MVQVVRLKAAARKDTDTTKIALVKSPLTVQVGTGAVVSEHTITVPQNAKLYSDMSSSVLTIEHNWKVFRRERANDGEMSKDQEKRNPLPLPPTP